jgi:hypothetical protein
MVTNQVESAFEKVREQIGFCGIWCGSCVVANGALSALTGRYEELVAAYGLREWVPGDFDFDEFQRGLTSIRDMPLCPGCRRGGGRDDCEIRACTLGRGLDGCRDCLEPATCESAEVLLQMQSGARAAGLFVTTERIPKEELIAQWTADLRSHWPSSILFE